MFSRIKRLLKHRWFDDASLRRSIPSTMLKRLEHRISNREQLHTGEIRVFIEAGLPNSYLLRQDATKDLIRQRAVMLFGKLRIWDTEHNNGVLIYLLLAERSIELVADRGISRHVSAELWQAMIAHMQVCFKESRFEEGLAQAIDEVSAVMLEHYPLEQGKTRQNELPDKLITSSGGTSEELQSELP